jgi:ABC-type nitrate/sulfonate/bicarbonate transport system ATPase subunit
MTSPFHQPFMAYELRDTILSVEHVSMVLGGKQILRDVNVSIRDVYRVGYTTGQIVAFLGPSGIGKSTLLRILAGLLKPTAGSVLLGADRRLTSRGMVGMVSQNCILFRHRTVLGNMEVAARQKSPKTAAAEARKNSLEMLAKFGLMETAEQYPSQLSGGQRQRVAICQQLVCSDHFLLMDEPFAALDYNNIQRAIKLIHDVADADELNTVIVVTHDIASALAVADRIWIMGRERDADQNIIPGGRIVREMDLIEAGLCWCPNITELPAFRDLKREIEQLWPSL